MKIKLEQLKNLINTVVRKQYDEKDAEIITDMIMFGEISGRKSHGITQFLLGPFSVFREKPQEKPTIIQKTKVSSIIEGNKNPGTLIGPIAMKEAIRLAKENGFGIVGTNGGFSSSGCLTYYLEKIANQDFISIIMAKADPSTAPHGSIQKIFATNPIAFGIPANPKPIILDMATAATSFGALRTAQILEKKIPKGVAIDQNGEPTTDPNEAINGAILTFGHSYKSSGLSMMVEVFAGMWTNSSYVQNNVEGGWGNLFMVVSPELLMNLDEFKKRAEILVDTVRNAKTRSGEKLRICGEKTIKTRDDSLKSGYCEVDENTIIKLKELK